MLHIKESIWGILANAWFVVGLEEWKKVSKGPPNLRVRRITEEDLWWCRLLES